MADLKSSAEWMQEFGYMFDIVDPDGWDRKNFEKSWAEPISKLTFFHRVMLSSCIHKVPYIQIRKEFEPRGGKDVQY
jgi:hypothetical protein